jgi:hypothetical protein
MTKEEIFKSKIKSIFILEDDTSKLFTEHFEKYDFFHTESPNKIGQYFLYEKFLDVGYDSSSKYVHQLFYPKLGIYINSLPCDQTIYVEWIDYRRTWEWKLKHDYEYDGKSYKNYIGELQTEIERLPLWDDSLLVYGVWDSIPTWQQLRQAYERTWWFHRTTDELRDLQLNRLLK